jgi:hydrogenase maturation protease
MMADVVVIGLGNVLVGDDAFGPFVVRTLMARYDMPEGAEVVDLGTPGLDLGPHIAGTRALIVVDTVKTNAAPGTLRCYRKEDLLARGPSPRTNPHQPSLADTLFFLQVQDEDLAPQDVLLVGVTPERYDTGAPLSDAVRAAVAEAAGLVVCELERLGYAPLPKAEPAEPDIWWERAVSTRNMSATCSA